MTAGYRYFLPLLFLAFLVGQGVGMADAVAGRTAQVQAKSRSGQAGAVAKQRKIRARAAKNRPASGLRTRAKQTLNRSRNAKRAKFGHKPFSRNKAAAPKQKARVAKKAKATAKTTRKAKQSAKAQRRSPASTKPQGNAQRAVKAIRSFAARVKAIPAVKRVTARIAKISAATTRKLDRLQARAPPWLAKTMRGLRTYSVVSLAAFNLTYLSRDPKFLGTFFAVNGIVSYGVLPGAIRFGMSPVVSTALNLLSTPVTALVLVMRDVQLKRRAGETVTMAQSAKSILKDFKAFATERQAQKSKRALALGAQ